MEIYSKHLLSMTTVIHIIMIARVLHYHSYFSLKLIFTLYLTFCSVAFHFAVYLYFSQQTCLHPRVGFSWAYQFAHVKNTEVSVIVASIVGRYSGRFVSIDSYVRQINFNSYRLLRWLRQTKWPRSQTQSLEHSTWFVSNLRHNIYISSGP